MGHLNAVLCLSAACAWTVACGGTDSQSSHDVPGFGGASENGGASVGTGADPAGGGLAGSGSGGAPGLDPHGEERRQVAADYCALLEQYACLTYIPYRAIGVTGNDAGDIEACRRDMEVQSTVWGATCFPEWRDHVRCLTDAPWSCPCPAGECVLDGASSAAQTTAMCLASKVALNDCRQSLTSHGDLQGTTGECSYEISVDTGCSGFCYRPLGTFEVECEGPPGGAQACQCLLNGVTLRDAADPDVLFWADDCASAVQAAADGVCEERLSCCFTWTDASNVPQCSCTADPTIAGFDSCADAAEAAGGSIVELCPQHQIDWNGFPDAP